MGTRVGPTRWPERGTTRGMRCDLARPARGRRRARQAENRLRPIAALPREVPSALRGRRSPRGGHRTQGGRPGAVLEGRFRHQFRGPGGSAAAPTRTPSAWLRNAHPRAPSPGVPQGRETRCWPPCGVPAGPTAARSPAPATAAWCGRGPALSRRTPRLSERGVESSAFRRAASGPPRVWWAQGVALVCRPAALRRPRLSGMRPRWPRERTQPGAPPSGSGQTGELGLRQVAAAPARRQRRRRGPPRGQAATVRFAGTAACEAAGPRIPPHGRAREPPAPAESERAALPRRARPGRHGTEHTSANGPGAAARRSARDSHPGADG